MSSTTEKQKIKKSERKAKIKKRKRIHSDLNRQKEALRRFGQ
jgi:hypothetical protein